MRRRPFIAGIGCALLLAACGGMSTDRRSATAPSVVVSTRSAVTVAVPVAPGQPYVHVASFRSPGRTIACRITATAARCAVATPSWRASSPCPTVAVQVLIVQRSGRGQTQCGVPRIAPAAVPTPGDGAPLKALPYGTITLVDGFACESYTGGVTCGAQAGGHGFFISATFHRFF